MPLSGRGQSVRLLRRRSRLRPVLRRNNTVVGERSVLELGKRPGEVIEASRPYDCIQLFSNWRWWSRGVDFKYCLRVHSRGALEEWHNIEIFVVPPLMHPLFYAARFSWWERVEF